MSIVNGQTRPDFIIIGSMKSGTTTLYRLLSLHPDIGMSRDKETDFFIETMNFPRGLQWYSDQFPAGRKVYGEASPNYTKTDDFTGVPARIKAHCPGVKLIYVVRDPVDRFVSQYRHSWTMGDIAMTPDALPQTSEYRHILNVSRYAHQLAAFRAHFASEDILIVDFDRLTSDPATVVAEVERFIGVSHHPLPQGGKFNDNAEISKIPAPILRFAQSRLGRSLAGLFDREMRDRIRGLLARGKARQPPPFPQALRARVREDLRDDVAQFRIASGMPFETWSL
ncbi:sulfotransferase [Aurantimonas sp. Leaf443]|uniref:sulfotransferase family protein n=1 Tax=Aurantimonas sp. Leaf443 TaxID=1736378 RepID=UPI0006FE7EDA|nr:sulfotransferase [Aurantimonas sp. Leaf443]KQT85083.1 hypothetical protein ASG48_07290 [Aurantimonas sp. Leaf443]